MRVVIVGGGCSGMLVAFHLLRNGFRDSLTIVEPRAELGRGLAYSTAFDGHLLNVAAEKMSGLPDDPAHFLDWLRARNFPEAAPGVYAPRRLYGEYLGSLLRDQLAAGEGQIRHTRAEVVAIDTIANAARLTLSDGTALDADKVVLALGNPASGSHASPAPAGMEDRWHGSPWLGDALRLRAPGERILLIGAGQTAVDAALALESQTGGCHIHMLSRSGNLPQVHPTSPATVPPLAIAPGDSLRRILHGLRAQVRRASERGIGWQAVIDALRPISNGVWHGLSLADRRRFHRHLKTWWETHRSRMAPSISEQMDRYRGEGSVEVIAGRLLEALPCDGSIEVRVALREGGERRLQVDRVMNCTGIHEYYHVHPRGLIAGLLQKGLASANDLGIGFRADENGALVGPAKELLFTLGPPRRGDLFETIAVPEIRVQAEALATHLCRR